MSCQLKAQTKVLIIDMAGIIHCGENDESKFSFAKVSEETFALTEFFQLALQLPLGPDGNYRVGRTSRAAS